MNVVSQTESVDKTSQRVRRMFGSIAGRYDFLNHLLSLNIDRHWRRSVTRLVPPVPGAPILDCCTGTADLAVAYDQASSRTCPIVGSDFCRPMLEIGHAKTKRAASDTRITLVEADTQRLPFPDAVFGIVVVAFGLRNVENTALGLSEMVRVARPGGTVAVLEFSKPSGRILGGLYRVFFRHVLPRVGQAIAPNSDRAYEYLPTSVLQFPEGQAMLDLMAACGLQVPRRHVFTGGIATLYVGIKPAVGAPS